MAEQHTPQTPPIDPSYLNKPVPAPPPSQVELARERAAKAAQAAQENADEHAGQLP